MKKPLEEQVIYNTPYRSENSYSKPISLKQQSSVPQLHNNNYNIKDVDNLSRYSNNDHNVLNTISYIQDDSAYMKPQNSKFATPSDTRYQMKNNGLAEYQDKNFIRNYSTSNLRNNNNIYTSDSFHTDTSVMQATKSYSHLNTPSHCGSLEKLKNKIRNLESKMGNFNKGKFLLKKMKMIKEL
jgi:hypothetical protein